MVVKCEHCKQFFTKTDEDTHCPFCHTEYTKAVAQAAPTGIVWAQAAKNKEKKAAPKNQKESFKIWSDIS
jgi:hypothetical protein